MLRMYECNWCWTRQVHDDSVEFKVPDKERMRFNVRFKCVNPECPWYKNRSGHPMMNAMSKDRDGDWVLDIYHRNPKTKASMEVTPPLLWH